MLINLGDWVVLLNRLGFIYVEILDGTDEHYLYKINRPGTPLSTGGELMALIAEVSAQPNSRMAYDRFISPVLTMKISQLPQMLQSA